MSEKRLSVKEPDQRTASQAQQWARWLAPVAVIVLLLVVFRNQLPFLGEARVVLRKVSWPPLIAAAVTAVLAMAAMAAVMQILLNIEGRIAGPARTNAVVYASNAWSTTIPGGPAISAWFTYRVQRSWGASVGLCGWFLVISGALSTVWMVILGIGAALVLGADLSLVSLLFSLAVAVLTMGALFWATRHPAALKRVTGGRPRASAFVDQLAAIEMTGGQFAAAAAFSLLNQLLDIATMLLSVWAVRGHAPGFTAGLNDVTVMGAMLAYIMTKLAGTAQVTPGGVGTVEPVAVGMLVAGGMTLVDATAATAIYRAVSFAMITAIGWVVFAAVYAGRGFMIGKAPE